MSLYKKSVTPTHLPCNDLISVADWTSAATGALTLAQNKTASVALIKLTGLPIGAQLINVTTHYGVGATSGGSATTLVTVSVRKVVAVAGGVTDTEIVGISEASYLADTLVNAVASPTSVVQIEEGYSYYVRVTSTTPNNAACDVALIGATAQYQ